MSPDLYPDGSTSESRVTSVASSEDQIYLSSTREIYRKKFEKVTQISKVGGSPQD
jgi:hypothetical protein